MRRPLFFCTVDKTDLQLSKAIMMFCIPPRQPVPAGHKKAREVTAGYAQGIFVFLSSN